jgi:hypothetical protein
MKGKVHEYERGMPGIGRLIWRFLRRGLGNTCIVVWLWSIWRYSILGVIGRFFISV